VNSRSTYRPPPLNSLVGFGLTVIPAPEGQPAYLLASKRSGYLAIRDHIVVNPTAASTTSAPGTTSLTATASTTEPGVVSLQGFTANTSTATTLTTLPPPVVEMMADGGAVVSQETPGTQKVFRVECSEDLTTWTMLDHVQTEDGAAEYYDPTAATKSRCFYRFVEVTTP
jgi:hypothetical protein